ncbi:MAG: sigma factor-like helix-turn-helix DNA-binding protein [Planctomycetota bacterium]
MTSLANLLTPSHDAIGRETAVALQAALDELSAEHREAITLARLVQLPHAVIAEVMERSELATRPLLARAMVQLTRGLRRRGIDLAGGDPGRDGS